MATSDELTAAGLRTVSNPHCRASALDLGATVVSWQPTGSDEVLFLSEDAAVGPGLEIHGGIPICAPWFGRGRDGIDVPRGHGLVRWVPWELVSGRTDDAGTHLSWVLDGATLAHLPGAAAYPGDLRYRHEVTFGAELTLRFTVESPTREFVLDEAFHAYFAVPAAQTRITGLDGVPHRDHAVDPPQWRTSDDVLVPDGAVDRVYHSSADIALESPRQTVRIRTRGAASVVVWNPGPSVPDNFGAGEWTRMVCVEAGNVQDEAVRVAAGGSHTLEMTVSVTPAAGHRGDTG